MEIWIMAILMAFRHLIKSSDLCRVWNQDFFRAGKVAEKKRVISQRRGRSFRKPRTNLLRKMNNFSGRLPILILWDFQFRAKYHPIHIKTLWCTPQRLSILKYYCSRHLVGTADICVLVSSASQHIPDGADELVVCHFHAVASCVCASACLRTWRHHSDMQIYDIGYILYAASATFSL